MRRQPHARGGPREETSLHPVASHVELDKVSQWQQVELSGFRARYVRIVSHAAIDPAMVTQLGVVHFGHIDDAWPLPDGKMLAAAPETRWRF